jgi:thioredoxin-related protein
VKAWLLLASLLGLVQPATDLQRTAGEAEARTLPILLYVSRSDCSFCRRFETEVLNPLIRSGEYTDRVIVRELVWDSPRPVQGFDGERVMPEALAAAYAAKLTPTLLFLDHRGTEVVPRITGYRRTEFFSYYVEASIREAAALLRKR